MAEQMNFGEQVTHHRMNRDWTEKKLAEEVSKIAAQTNSEQKTVSAQTIVNWQLGGKPPSENMYIALEMVLIEQNPTIEREDAEKRKKEFLDAYEEAIAHHSSHDKQMAAQRIFGALIMRRRVELDMRESDLAVEINGLASDLPSDKIEAADAMYISQVERSKDGIKPSRKWASALASALELSSEAKQSLMLAYDKEYPAKRSSSVTTEKILQPTEFVTNVLEATLPSAEKITDINDASLNQPNLDIENIEAVRTKIVPLLKKMGLTDGKGNVSPLKVSQAIAKIPKSLSVGQVSTNVLETLLVKTDITFEQLAALQESAVHIKSGFRQINQSKDIIKLNAAPLSMLQKEIGPLLNALLAPVQQRGVARG